MIGFDVHGSRLTGMTRVTRRGGARARLSAIDTILSTDFMFD
jgi:hypothetical protein